MISINKEEAKIIREKLPRTHIVRTMKQHSSRGRYFVEESSGVMRLIRKIRDQGGDRL